MGLGFDLKSIFVFHLLTHRASIPNLHQPVRLRQPRHQVPAELIQDDVLVAEEDGVARKRSPDHQVGHEVGAVGHHQHPRSLVPDLILHEKLQEC